MLGLFGLFCLACILFTLHTIHATFTPYPYLQRTPRTLPVTWFAIYNMQENFPVLDGGLQPFGLSLRDVRYGNATRHFHSGPFQ